MTPYAHTDPVMGLLTRGFAVQVATTNPRKLIVVIGMWLWLFPMFVLGMLACSGSVAGFTQGESLFAVLMVAFGLLFVWISATILYRTTVSYVRQQRSRRGAGADDRADQDETECLDCGEKFPAQVTACPSCGWSFAQGDYKGEIKGSGFSN